MFVTNSKQDRETFLVLRSPSMIRRTTRGPLSNIAPFEIRAKTTIANAAPPLLDLKQEKLNRTELFSLSNDPEVLGIASSMPTKLMAPFGTEENGRTDIEGLDIVDTEDCTWGISAIGAQQSDFTGAGVKIAVLDTGIDDQHPVFCGVTFQKYDFTTGQEDEASDGHGTHCAGTIFGRPAKGFRIGVAHGVSSRP